jgi:RNA polymerase sigma-70 factor (ECF subfamily)
MSKSPETRPSLLVRIRDARDDSAWREFVEIYAPLVHAYARSRGLQDADAADVAQEVLQAVSSHVGRFDYQPDRGTFRGWLFQITLNKLRRAAARRHGKAIGTGDTRAMEQLIETPASDGAEQQSWDQHHAWRLFLWAAERARVDFRDRTWQAFWRTAVEHQPVRQVADELRITPGAVHIARCRVIARIKEITVAAELD